MKIKYIVILLLPFIFYCCKKQANNNVAVGYTIQGKARYYDYANQDTVILDSQMVYIKNYTDAGDTFYIYAVQTDINGYFVFSSLPDTGKYIIYTKPIEKSNASFTGTYFAADTTFIFPQDTVRLLAQDTVKENGIQVTTVDVNGNIIPGALVTFYYSKVVALDDTLCTGAGSIASGVTNSSGKYIATKFTTAGKIYINAALIVDSGYTLKNIAIDTTVAKTGLTGTGGPFIKITDTLK